MRLMRLSMAALLAWGMVCLPLSAAPAAMVTPLAGTVSLNGQSVVSGSAVLPGDAILVSAQSGARLTLPGAAILAGANSRFQLQANAIRLSYGTLKVSGREAVRTARQTITPVTSGIFTVVQTAGVLYVAANRGALRVVSGHKTFNIAAGSAMRFQTGTPDTGRTGMGGVSDVSLPVAIGVIAAAAATVGVIAYEATNCSGCVVSASF